MTLGERIKNRRKMLKLTQKQLASKMGIDNTTISKWESDTYEPDAKSLNRLSEILDASTDYLLCRTDNPNGNTSKKNDLPELTAKDERDIAKDLENIINNLEGKDGYSHFGGQAIEDMDEEDRELLIASLENSMRLAKRIAKQKFTPKKYRDKD